MMLLGSRQAAQRVAALRVRLVVGKCGIGMLPLHFGLPVCGKGFEHLLVLGSDIHFPLVFLAPQE